MEGRSVAPPAATLRPFDCAQGRAVGVFETAVYGPAEAVPFRVVASMGWSGGGDGRERSRYTRDAHHTTPTDKERPPGARLIRR
jgi:hypothetical protein